MCGAILVFISDIDNPKIKMHKNPVTWRAFCM